MSLMHILNRSFATSIVRGGEGRGRAFCESSLERKTLGEKSFLEQAERPSCDTTATSFLCFSMCPLLAEPGAVSSFSSVVF